MLLAFLVAPRAGAASSSELVEVFSTALELPGGVFQLPEWLFAFPEKGEILATGRGLLDSDRREVAWFLWKVDAQGKVLKQETVSAKIIGENVVLMGCLLNSAAEGICLGEGKGGGELVSVRVPFDGSAQIVARATGTGMGGTQLHHLLKLSDGRFIGLGSQFAKPYAMVFEGDGKVSWAQIFPAEHQGRIDGVLEGRGGTLVLSGVVFGLEKPSPAVPFLVRIDKRGRVLARKQLEKLEGRLVITLGEAPMGESSTESQGDPAVDLSAVQTLDLESLFKTVLPDPHTTIGSEWVVSQRMREVRPELVLLNKESVEVATHLFSDLIYSPGARLASAGNDSFVFLSPETPMKTGGGIRRGMRLMLFRIVKSSSAK